MPVAPPDIPSSGHYGEWLDFFGYAIRWLLQDSEGVYIDKVPDEEIDFYDGKYAYARPHIYIIPQASDIDESGMAAAHMDIIFKIRIVVEVYNPDKNEARREGSLIIGDILGILANDRKITINETTTAKNLEFDTFDPLFIMDDDLDDVLIWLALDLEIWKDLILPIPS